MAVGGTGSVTERLESMGREAGQQEYTQHLQSMSRQPDPFTRAARAVENSIRQKPVTWALVSLGVGCAIGATWFLSTRDWR